MEAVIDKTYRGVRFFLDVIVANCAALVLLGATILALVEIVRRYMFGVVFDWGQDAVTYYMVAAVFIFCGVTQARRSHLAMSAAMDVLRAKGFEKVVLVVRTFVTAISLALFSCFAWWGIPTVERMYMLHRKSQSMVVELWPFMLCLVIAFALMALTTLFQLYQDIQAVRGKTVFPWAPVEEGIEV
jgi:TRAP-type C4-dicarboxylate transport system permease small subunit